MDTMTTSKQMGTFTNLSQNATDGQFRPSDLENYEHFNILPGQNVTHRQFTGPEFVKNDRTKCYTWTDYMHNGTGHF